MSDENSIDQTSGNSAGGTFEAPYPGSKEMPQWDTNELIDAPKFTLKNWMSMLGPGLIIGGAAIGGGEWLVGPKVTAKYGGALLWLATISVLSQVLYNIEISRYTLYTGEPIFTGKFRTMPGPKFWVFAYLLFDFGSVFPYLAATASAPLFTAIYGHIPDPESTKTASLLGMQLAEGTILQIFVYLIFIGALVPLVFGGKILNALKYVMAFKIFTVMGFLVVLAILTWNPGTWTEIFSGFVKFGNVPIERSEDLNGNGVLDDGEDWDSDGNLDIEEPTYLLADARQALKDGNYKLDLDGDGKVDQVIAEDGETALQKITLDLGDGPQEYLLNTREEGKSFVDADKDGTRDGDNVDNIFSSIFRGDGVPSVDWTLIAFLSALVAISGSGGLSNTPISNYTRDEGWGMGHHVGAIPSAVGGLDLQLSHVGCVFEVSDASLPRWKRWYKHVVRDQVVVWLPACFLGLALPSMLSVAFLDRGFEADGQWNAAVMTADGVAESFVSDAEKLQYDELKTTIQSTRGDEQAAAIAQLEELKGNRSGSAAIFWFMTVFCGFLVLAPSMSTSADGIIRRWVDVFWTSSAKLRQKDPKAIKGVYFKVLLAYAAFGLVALSLGRPVTLLLIATTIYNFALGFSCLHVWRVNVTLLPKALRPHFLIQLGLILSGVFFLFIAVVSSLSKLGYI